MPLENNLRIIMAKKMVNNLTELIKVTGLSRNALNKLWHNQDVETVKLDTLVQICNSLDIKLSELVEYRPDKEGETSAEKKI